MQNVFPFGWLFLLLLVIPILLIGRLLFRKPFSPFQWILYFTNQLLVHYLWRAEIPTDFPLRADQGAVVICNHRSSIDPCIIQAAAGERLVHWMVAGLYAEGTLIGRLLKQFEIIPVSRRGGGASSAKEAIRRASRGELVGMLPEGSINRGEEFMKPVRPGAALVALKAQVPVLPCYIEGAPYHDIPWRPAFMRARVRLKVGDPVDISEFFGREREEGVVQQVTLKCVQEIARLAGEKEFKPHLAGRDWKTWE